MYEVIAGRPSWSSLIRLACETTARMAVEAVIRAIKNGGGRSSEETDKIFSKIRTYLHSELPPVVVRDVLDVCLARDRFRCHHNPTDCLALELWRVFFSDKFSEVTVLHHAFAFPKTTNYPDIVLNLESLLSLLSATSSSSHSENNNVCRRETRSSKLSLNENNNASVLATAVDDKSATITSFKLELKQCEVGCLLQDKIVRCVASLASAGHLRVLEIPGLGSDELLHVIALNCTKLEILNVRGSREQISDAGFCRYVDKSSKTSREALRQLDISRCMVTQQVLPYIQRLTGLRDLRISNRVLDDLVYGCDGQAEGPDVSLPNIDAVSVENENAVQVSVNKVMASMRCVFPSARHVALTNCIACELHVTLTQQPTNITYMRQHIHTLDLVSADYFHFPRLVYPCPNLESLHIEKPTNDIFNIDAANLPFLYGNTVPFVNLKNLRLSRISLTNLSHFLSKSTNLRNFKVTNIGRRERPRWTDDRIRQILNPSSVPRLEEFHVSCLTNEGFSTVESHRCLHLTKGTVQYLAENFVHLKRIAGIESWTRDCTREALNSLLNSDTLCGKFSIISL